MFGVDGAVADPRVPMIRRLSRRGRDEPTGPPAGSAEAAPLFNLEELHERRIHSWSPELDPDAADAPAEPVPPPVEARPDPAPAESRAASPAPAPPPRPEPTPAIAAEAAVARRRRGRPKGRPRRQVHFHVDPDEEVLLLGAVEKFGSQQKGLIAALQALQDIEVVRDEVERLTAECERQRKQLDQAESIFGR